MMVVWSGCLRLVPYRLCQVYGASNCCFLRQLDVPYDEVYESLFWLQTSVQANAIHGISHSFIELNHGDLVLRVLVNGLVYGINLLKFYVRSTITHNIILGNLKRMRTITHAIGTRPFFRPSVQLEKKRPGTEANSNPLLSVAITNT